MASSASTMREPRTNVVAWAWEASRLPTAAVQAATANCSDEIASDNFSFARDFPARSIRTEFKFSILVKEVKEVTVTSFTHSSRSREAIGGRGDCHLNHQVAGVKCPKPNPSSQLNAIRTR